ncbi:hypothetical protein, partial [Rubrivirga sp.]|uniref:hypothetical protein n=1 Tax=Rubrivirga sp. TaxID=1885344 RepID=UPI003C719580
MPTDPPRNPDLWARVADVFDAVVDLPTGEQESELDRLCLADGSVDATLRAEVEALLAADRSAPTEDRIDLASAAELIS